MLNWIEIEKNPPPIKEKVLFSYGLVGIRGSICDDWITTGWMHESGVFSLKQNGRINLHSKPTHWCKMPESSGKIYY